jgi:putative ABC transport system permease protein
MLKNYLLIALRNFKNNKVFTFINIMGLALGLAGCLLIILFTYNEISFEKLHKKRDLIYRVALYLQHGDSKLPFAAAMPPLAPALASMFPEVDNTVRIRQVEEVVISNKNSEFKETNFVYTENSFFQIFSYKLSQGTSENALIKPYSIVISEEISKKYFGNANPIGEYLRINGAHDFKITGLLKKVVGNSQLNFDFLASYSSLENMGLYSGAWGQFGVDHNFILLHEGASEAEFRKKLPQVINENVDPGLAALIKLDLQSFKDIYFHSKMNGEFTPSGDIQKVYLFSIIAFLILFIACLNFANLSTARSIKRAKEISIRKIFGSSQNHLRRQFIFESIILTLMAMILGLFIFRLFYPLLNNHIGRELPVFYFTNPFNLIILLALAVIVGFIAGLYPAFYLSSLDPIKILHLSQGLSSSTFRKIIVVIQFSIAITLMIITFIVYKQLHYIKTVDLGFEKRNKLIISLTDEENQDKLEVLKKEFLQIPSVKSITACFSPPGSAAAMMMNTMEENKTMDDGFLISAIPCDLNFISLFNIKILEGRDFSEEHQSDKISSVIINASAVRQFGFEQPLGKKIMIPGKNYQLISAEIIGVVEDFKFRSLKEEVSPLMLFYSPSNFSSLVIDYTASHQEDLVAAVRSAWNKVTTGEELHYSFLEDDYSRLYKSEEKMGQLFIFFSLLVLVIACLGIFGLTSFMTEQKIKEIGIRKVLGAGINRIIYLLTGNFLKWVLISNLIAIPVSIYIMQKWLNNFSYRTRLEFWIFLLAAGLSFLIAFLTMSFQTFQAARQNPAVTLKCE